jgi:predicted nucleic acid-binding protein
VNSALVGAEIICLDSAPLIYLIENHAEFAPRIAPIVQEIDSGRRRGISSVISLLEILVKPIQQGRADLVASYRRRLLGQPNFRVLDVGAAIAERAAEIRSVHRFKTPDAIQLATAELARADVFITNDRDLARFADVPVVLVSELAA